MPSSHSVPFARGLPAKHRPPEQTPGWWHWSGSGQKTSLQGSVVEVVVVVVEGVVVEVVVVVVVVVAPKQTPLMQTSL